MRVVSTTLWSTDLGASVGCKQTIANLKGTVHKEEKKSHYLPYEMLVEDRVKFLSLQNTSGVSEVKSLMGTSKKL